MKSSFNTLISNMKTNWQSGLTVALVSIPLSVSLAVASQSTPIAGIVTAIWAGLISSIFGGSNFNIVGPTGALSGILATYAIAHGAQALPTLAIVTGILILISYVLKLEKYLVYVPASTMHGFTFGVAFIIGLNQLNFALGLSNLPKHEKFIQNLGESFKHINQSSFDAILVFIIFLILMFVLTKVVTKIPAAIILAPVGILLGYLTTNNVIPLTLQTLASKYTVEPHLFLPSQFLLYPNMVVPAITVTLIAIIETMISARIADSRTKTKHNKRKEMFGLGLANIVSGLAGGMPATAALARTSTNIKTGATHKTSATISSICIALISLVLISYFKFLPMPVIAAILVFIAARMVETEHFERMWKVDKINFSLAMIVAFITVYEDPIVGILIGTCISLFIFVDKLSKGQYELVVNDANKNIVGNYIGSDSDNDEMTMENGETLIYSLKGQLAYINGQTHIARFEKNLNGFKNIVLRMRELYFIDLDGVDAFEEIVEILTRANKNVLLTGVNPLISGSLAHSKAYMHLKEKGLIFNKTSDALKSLGYSINQ